MIASRHLLWIDCTAGLLAGAAMVLLHPWLSQIYSMPQWLVLAIAAANVTYGIFSGSLAARPFRPRSLIVALVLANALWAVSCSVAAALLLGSASIWGIAHVLLEGVFVAGLARFEWKHRALLIGDPLSPAKPA